MAAYRRVYDSHHLQADCQKPGSAPEPYARRSSMGHLYLFLHALAPPASPRTTCTNRLNPGNNRRVRNVDLPSDGNTADKRWRSREQLTHRSIINTRRRSISAAAACWTGLRCLHTSAARRAVDFIRQAASDIHHTA